jgi:hypothetical protein
MVWMRALECLATIVDQGSLTKAAAPAARPGAREVPYRYGI